MTNPDIEDAEFETLGNDRARKTGASVAKTDAANVNKGMSLPVFTLVAVLASGVSFYAAGGHALISASFATITAKEPERAAAEPAPASGPVASTNGFELSDVTTLVDTGRGSPVLVVRGRISATEKGGVVPPLRLTFRDAKTGQSMTHVIARGELLQAGEAIRFTTRIPAGDYGGAEPVVSFHQG